MLSLESRNARLRDQLKQERDKADILNADLIEAAKTAQRSVEYVVKTYKGSESATH